jgi:stalled ribosome alternative rescue factor ArfA
LLKDSFKKTNRWSGVDDNDIKALVGMDGYRTRQKLNRKDLGEIFSKALKL